MRVVRLVGRLMAVASVLVVAVAVAVTQPHQAAGAAEASRDVSRFACPATATDAFGDDDGSVHEAAIDCLVGYGFINGTSATTFSPNGRVTRGQFASFVARLLAFAGARMDNTHAGFGDTGESVHYDAINAVANFGIVQGITPERFAPDAPLTRAQAASMVYRLLDLYDLAPVGTDAFSDDDGLVHEPAINALAQLGLLGGFTPDQFGPGRTLSRGAAASIFARTQDLMVERAVSVPAGRLESIHAPLMADEVVPGPGQGGAHGRVELVRSDVEGLLCVRWQLDAGLGSTPTAAHVHVGRAGEAGPVVLELPAPSGTAGEARLQLGCVAGVSPSAIDSVWADPAAHYVDLHTSSHPEGALRGALTTVAASTFGYLNGSDPGIPRGDSHASGETELDVLADGETVCASARYRNPDSPAVAVHLHEAVDGGPGPVLAALPPLDAQGTLSGCATVSDRAALERLRVDPGGFYIDVHTESYPDGAGAGSLRPARWLGGVLSSTAVIPGPGDPDATGELLFPPSLRDAFCVDVTLARIGRAIAMDIHEGAAGDTGPVVADVVAAPIFNSQFICTDLGASMHEAMRANPADYYVQIRTGDRPNGALRAQLQPVEPSSTTRFATDIRSAAPRAAV